MGEDRRRTPQQERSRRSVDAILDATSALLIDHDPGAITMSAIGARAGVSKAAIYRYFPDRPAVIRALAGRYLERFDLFLEEQFAGSFDLDDAAERVGEVLMAYYQLFLDEPELRAIWITGFSAPDVGDFVIEYEKSMARKVFDQIHPVLTGTPEVSMRRLLVMIHVLRSAVELAIHEGPEEGERIMNETRRLFLRGANIGSSTVAPPQV